MIQTFFVHYKDLIGYGTPHDGAKLKVMVFAKDKTLQVVVPGAPGKGKLGTVGLLNPKKTV